MDTFDISVALLVGYLAFLMTILCLYFEKKIRKKKKILCEVQAMRCAIFVQTAGDFALAKICYKGSKSHW